MPTSTPARNVLVTGAAGGMCSGINSKLAAAGHTVLCADLNLEAARHAADQVISAGGSAQAFALDVTSDDSVAALREQLQESVGDIGALVNAAGILDRKYLSDLDAASFQRALEINLVGPFRMIKAFGPELVAQGWGRIINISSIAGTTGYPYPSYAASKAGLSNMTRSLLVDFWGTGVTINSICPGVVDTPMVIQEVRDQVKRKVPTEQIIAPEEIGALVCFLLTEESRSINGADLVIDGGATQVFQLFDRQAPAGA
jgi:NAD(P)-dependent dehydrogenase (short-subunit alcohol dehydrogenase family)